jgi:hypothetical protein
MFGYEEGVLTRTLSTDFEEPIPDELVERPPLSRDDGLVRHVA